MTAEFVEYSLEDGIATIRIDDGKRNALSPQVIKEIYAAFDRAEADRATVILTGRETVFSAGFDLNVMKRGGTRAIGMLRSGYALTARVLNYPRPVIVACNGHVLAMGVFLMLSADYVIGTRGDFRISANEVALGIPSKVHQGFTRMIPMGRPGTVEEAAGGVYLFCVPESDYVSGQTVIVGGGVTL